MQCSVSCGGVAEDWQALCPIIRRRAVGSRTRGIPLRRGRFAEVIVDVSALLAVLFAEPDARRYSQAVAEAWELSSR